jgi:hypothetical protein
MEPPSSPSSTASNREAGSGVPGTPPGWDDYRAARERFLRTLQIDSLNRLLARPDAGQGRFEARGAR